MLSYAKLYLPFVLTCVASLAIDIAATAYTSVDFTRSMSVEGVMTLLEVRNRREMHGLFNQTDPFIPAAATGNMLLLSAKYVFFFVLNIIVIVITATAGWDVISESKRRGSLGDKHSILTESSDGTIAPTAPPAYEVNLETERIK